MQQLTKSALAKVYVLTERLDDTITNAHVALQPASAQLFDAGSYITSWQQVADPVARHQQLQLVLALGMSLDGLTRKPSLRMLLKLTRGPAAVAGLGRCCRLRDPIERIIDSTHRHLMST